MSNISVKPSMYRRKSKPTSLAQDSVVSSNASEFKLLGQPVEEVDPFVFEDTFCVIARKFGKHHVFRFSASKSLFIFGPLNPIRKLACRIITNMIFDIFIIMVIIANCCTLAMNSNEEIIDADGKPTGEMREDEKRNRIIELLEYIFLGFYTLEMLLKITAKGFIINKFSYLRSLWNIMDFVVVSAGYIAILLALSFIPGQYDLDFLSTLRVLRAIKTISIIPGLRMMINALLKSVTQLVEVMILTLFCLMIFSLLALQLFMGKMSHKCVLTKNGSRHRKMVLEELSRETSELENIDPKDPDSNLFWYKWVNREENWFKRKDNYPGEEYQPCANRTSWSGGRDCPEGYICLPDIGATFDDGWTNFDNFFYSMLTTFQLLTTDFWERPYDLIISTTNPVSVFFCIIVIFLGFFYLLNLLLAVVAMSYEEEFQETTMVVYTKHQKLSLNRKASTFSFDDPRNLNVNVMTHYQKRTPSEREMIARTLRETNTPRDESEFDDQGQKRPNLHQAIMTLLGRHVSSVHAGKNKSASRSKTTPQTSKILTTEISRESIPLNDDRVGSAASIAQVDDNKTRKRISGVTNLARSTVKTLATAANQSYTGGSKFLRTVRNFLLPIVEHTAFEVVITSFIIINTVLLASEHHNQPDWLDKILDHGNHFFTAVFLVEAVIKICALQKQYFLNWWNLFDLFVVLMSLVDFFLGFGGFKMLRSFRLLRVFKLAQSWITMKILMNIIFSTFGALGNLTLIILIVIYIFAVLGMQTIGKYYTRGNFDALSPDDLEKFPRWNFQNFAYAFMMVFRVLCGEWIEPLWDCLKATSAKNSGYMCFLLFLPIFIVGNLIILNLFLALLLNSFDTEELESKRLEELEASGKANDLKKILGTLAHSKAISLKAWRGSSSSDLSGFRSVDNSNLRGKQRFKSAARTIIAMNRKKVASRMVDKNGLKAKQEKSSKTVQYSLISKAKESSFGIKSPASQDSFKQIKQPDLCWPKKCWQMNCCFCRCCRKCNWKCWDALRGFAIRVVTHPIFEWFILALIFASSITLCFEDVTLDKKPNLKNALFYVSTVFTFIFVMEMLLKWLGLGLWVYFTSSWTLLDCFIVCVSLTSWANEMEARVTGVRKEGNSFAALKALRTLRALRPLRAISRWQGMKIVVNALMFAIPSIVNVLLVCLLFWLIFSIMGVQFFKGRFYRCVDNSDGEVVDIQDVATKDQCCNETNVGRFSWINQRPNFDNVFSGYLTLFQVATFEGWMEAMQASVDADEVDKQPKRDNNMWAYLFYVIFIVFGSFFTLNLFIGVIIDNFNRLKKKYEGNLVEILLTPSQRSYYTAMKKLGRKKPRRVIRRPTNSLLSLFYDISMSRQFEIALFVLIFLNMIIMAFNVHKQSKLYVDMLDACNSFFTFIYALEAVVKIIGLRKYYFTVPWNLFDFVLVFASMVDIAVEDLFSEIFRIPPTMLRIVRVFRIGRVLRLIKAAKGIRKLLFALVVSLPAIFNIGALLGLITFIYAILGMALFSGAPKNEAIDEVFNFDTFGSSCLMLLRLMIMAAGWNDVLSALTVEKPVCGTYRNIKCGNSKEGEPNCPDFLLAVIYLVSFLIITDLIVINMYVAVILENFYDASQEEEVGIVEDDLEMFYVRWSRYDPQATQFIDFELVSDFLASLDPPLGLPKPNIVAIVAFNLPIAQGNKIHCLDILHSLIKHVLGHVDDSEGFRKMQEEMEHKFRRQFPTRKLLEIISSTRVWKIQHNAATIIQRAWREYRARKYPTDVARANANPSQHSTAVTHHKDHHGMLNRMGNLLSLGQKRRLSMASVKNERSSIESNTNIPS